MSRSMSGRMKVIFSDVAICFSEGEWQLLEEWQKELYQNVMKEIHGALISLGYRIVNPDTLFRIKPEEEPYMRNHIDKKGIIAKDNTGFPLPKPDILLRLKDEETHFSDHCSKGTEENSKATTRLRLRERALDRVGRPAQTYRAKLCNSFESSTSRHPEDVPMSAWLIHPAIYGNTVYGGSVFNPDMSLWIKEVDAPDSSDSDDHDLDGRESIHSPTTEDEIAKNTRKSQLEECLGNSKLPEVSSQKKRSAWHRGKPFGYRVDKSGQERGFSILQSLIVQQGPYIGERPYPCNEYEQRTSAMAYLLQQEKNRKGDRPCLCAVCGKGFRDRAGLMKHRRTHTGGRSYKCTECEKSFTQKWNLIQHQRTHTGERPYKCSECEKSFMYNSVLIKHQRIHTGERPYQCSQCEKNFSAYSGLIRHQGTHAGLRPYTCTECGETYSQKHNLTKHRATHNIQVPYTGNRG
ncbi:zinc finger protein 436-like isoform X2 [Rhinatrema bivittatum]|uniref:zinc finger protein 436-like isoform X2 n=1 Tax=Rhinatrema bivittatum TaxID=194408 RepID=UPI00112EEC97|nr:zinc finger protein 436-like isoform X2 [Rhinatrema bivittatum]